MKFGRFTIVILLLSLPGFAGATIVDLTTAGSSGTINGAIFQQINPYDSAGTGVFSSIVQIQNNGVEEGYNTGGKTDLNTKSGQARALLLSQIPTVTIGSTTYREFCLDINQTLKTAYLSLDAVKIYLSDVGNLTGYPTNFGTATEIYDMDQNADSWVKMNYRLNAGSGRADVALLVDSSLFGTDNNKYVYLYSKFGVNLEADDGFEEWGVGVGGAVTPEPATIAVLALGSLALRRCKK